jgi:hypothetical protein
VLPGRRAPGGAPPTKTDANPCDATRTTSMKRWTWAAACTFIGLAVWAATAVRPSAQGAQESPGEWVSLFDGQTLSGWEMLELGRPGSSKWEVKDGALTGTGQPSMLFSPKGGYKNFRIRAEIKINDKGNSGMYVRTPKEKTFTKGYEIQINSTHSDPVKTGSVYTYVEVYKKLVPPDEWFTQEVEVIDRTYRDKGKVPHIKVLVNGDLLYMFRDHTAFAKEGYFAFQQHDPGSVVQIRKVEVMELPDAK